MMCEKQATTSVVLLILAAADKHWGINYRSEVRFLLATTGRWVRVTFYLEASAHILALDWEMFFGASGGYFKSAFTVHYF